MAPVALNINSFLTLFYFSIKIFQLHFTWHTLLQLTCQIYLATKFYHIYTHLQCKLFGLHRVMGVEITIKMLPKNIMVEKYA